MHSQSGTPGLPWALYVFGLFGFGHPPSTFSKCKGPWHQHVTGEGIQVQRGTTMACRDSRPMAGLAFTLGPSGGKIAHKALSFSRVNGEIATCTRPCSRKLGRLRRGPGSRTPLPTAPAARKQFPPSGEAPGGAAQSRSPSALHPPPSVPSASAAQEGEGNAEQGRVHPSLTCHRGRAGRSQAADRARVGHRGPRGPHPASPLGCFLTSAPDQEPTGLGFRPWLP